MKNSIVKWTRKGSIESAWINFQRHAMDSLESKDYAAAERYLLSAYSLTEKMSQSDPRVLITLEKLAEVAEAGGKFNEAIQLTHKLVERKIKLLGVSSLVLNDLKRLIRLYSRIGNVAETQRLTNWYINITLALRLGQSAADRNSQSNTLPPSKGLRSIIAPRADLEDSLTQTA